MYLVLDIITELKIFKNGTEIGASRRNFLHIKLYHRKNLNRGNRKINVCSKPKKENVTTVKVQYSDYTLSGSMVLKLQFIRNI